MMNRFSHVITSLFFAATAFPALAEDRPVVVELFTSQGCSSCPPADALLHDLAKRDDVIALALHVDYWDYIGWKDSFGDAAFSHRQRAYATVQSERMVYTPQMMLNGTEHVVGNRKPAVLAAVGRHDGQAALMDLEATQNGNRIMIKLNNSRRTDDMMVHVVAIQGKSSVDIRRGENAGKTISYANVVTDWRTVGKWDGHGAVTFNPSKPKGGDGYVVLIQQKNHGEVLAATYVK